MAAAEAAFLQATSAAGEQRERLSLAGGSVDFRFAGGKLRERLLPVFAHARSSATGPATLTVLAWDSASSGVPMPRAPWEIGDFGERGVLAQPPAVDLFASFQVDAGVLSVFDAARRVAMYWARDHAALPTHERAAPLRTILHLWVSSRGGQFLHGAAVGGAQGAALLAGPGGVGKSNTALACLTGGLGYLGDDYCAAFPGTPPTIHCLYASGKLSSADLARFPSLATRVVNPERAEQDKALCLLDGDLQERIVSSAPLRAVLIPRLTGGVAGLRRISAAAALVALAPSTIVQLPHAGETAFRTMARLLKEVPCFALDLGGRRDDVVPLVRAALATAQYDLPSLREGASEEGARRQLPRGRAAAGSRSVLSKG